MKPETYRTWSIVVGLLGVGVTLYISLSKSDTELDINSNQHDINVEYTQKVVLEPMVFSLENGISNKTIGNGELEIVFTRYVPTFGEAYNNYVDGKRKQNYGIIQIRGSNGIILKQFRPYIGQIERLAYSNRLYIIEILGKDPSERIDWVKLTVFED